ncbi:MULTISPECIES: hypothetical protein [Bacillus cereus group]|uniref:Uncharacterized protein n=1 Tax=Bacillus thuringiensis TaxID=1428 RepID=A0A9X7FY66_BACTU|nr:MULTISPECIES: hypothetical protein [Bacillus cereus group]EKS7858154.1 hypothetical protein [Bacillus cereus]MDM5370457.1 hypothetical protein [Bacillus bombysepticus]PEV64070.1 hypothetical protein CN434_25010 [Bacillus thuringiensis]PFT50904.1 hypothetical protein COK72_02525 [Bacillus thuringiensis]PFY22941.1 hypothetical protein COL44_18845 [Bacillus toyonensis]
MDILLLILIEMLKTIVRETVVFGFKKLSKKRNKKTTRSLKRGGSRKKRNK